MIGNLKSLNKLLENSRSLKEYFAFDISSAVLITELRFGDYFLIYKSKKNPPYLLMRYYTKYCPGDNSEQPFREEGKTDYSCHLSLQEVLEEINCVLTKNYQEQFAVHTDKWYSALPPWLNLNIFYVSALYTDSFLKEILKSEENMDLFSDGEKSHFAELKRKLVAINLPSDIL